MPAVGEVLFLADYCAAAGGWWLQGGACTRQRGKSASAASCVPRSLQGLSRDPKAEYSRMLDRAEFLDRSVVAVAETDELAPIGHRRDANSQPAQRGPSNIRVK
jgi:hypothetical protein